MADVASKQHVETSTKDIKDHITARIEDQTRRHEALLSSLSSALKDYDRRIQSLEVIVRDLQVKITKTHDLVCNVAPNERQELAKKIDSLGT